MSRVAIGTDGRIGTTRRCRRRSLGIHSATMSLSQSLADAQLQNHFHACAFVMGPNEERAVIDPFFVEGMRRGEKAVYIVDPARAKSTRRDLRASAPSSDLLEVTTWNEAHLKGGSFDQERMMAALDEMIRDHAAAGNPPMRLVGQMGWVFSSPPGIEAARRLRGERQRGSESRQDADRLRVRRAPLERLDDDGPAARAPADGHERRAAREPVLHARGRDAARPRAAPRDELTACPTAAEGTDDGKAAFSAASATWRR